MAYRAFIWRHNNPEKRSEHRRKYVVRKKLKELGYLPLDNSLMNEEQKELYEQIGRSDYSFWDKVKSKNGHDGGTRIRQQKKQIRSAEYRLWDRLRQSAKDSGKEFTIEVEDIIIPEYCPYLNVKLTTEQSDYKLPNYYTGDRIDSSLGYIKGNVQVLSFLANTMKNNATIEQLVEFSKNIIKLYS